MVGHTPYPHTWVGQVGILVLVLVPLHLHLGLVPLHLHLVLVPLNRHLVLVLVPLHLHLGLVPVTPSPGPGPVPILHLAPLPVGHPQHQVCFNLDPGPPLRAAPETFFPGPPARVFLQPGATSTSS